MVDIFLYILPIAAICGLILLYGKVKQDKGELTQKVKEDGVQNRREADAKEIESEPAPTDADDVADAWRDM